MVFSENIGSSNSRRMDQKYFFLFLSLKTMENSGFLLASNIPDEVLGNQQFRNASEHRPKKKKPRQKPALSRQKTSKEAALPGRKCLDGNSFTLAKQHREKCGSTSTTTSKICVGAQTSIFAGAPTPIYLNGVRGRTFIPTSQ